MTFHTKTVLHEFAREVDLKRQVSIKDIAARAGVSIGTVDRVLHNRGEVSDETREKIRKIIKEVDYQPNIMASTLASKKQVLFCTLLPTPLSREGYWTKPVVGIKKRMAELKQYGIALEPLTFRQDDPRDFDEQAARLLELKPDGVVLAPFFFKEANRFIEQLKEDRIPFVFIDSNIPDQGQLAYIGQNSFQCGMLSARLLSWLTPEKGLLMVLHYAREMEHQNHLLQREKGFYEWFSQNQPEREVKTFELSISNPDDCEKRLTSLCTEYHPSGIFVTSSKVYLAARALAGLVKQNIRLIGHDLLPENRKFLTERVVDFLICQRPEEQGYNAIDTLFQAIVRKVPVRDHLFAPIDIITPENLEFYNVFKYIA